MLTNYLNFYIRQLLGKLDEYRLYYYDDFSRILNGIDNPIARDLLRLRNTENGDLNINFIDIDIQKNGSAVYRQDTKVDRKVEDEGWDLDNSDRRRAAGLIKPTSIKIGRLVQKILTLRGESVKYTAAEVEDFVNKFVASQSSMEFRFEEYEGDGMMIAYDRSIYDDSNTDSELWGSCMVDKPHRFFDIYTKNPDVCHILVCYNKDNKISGRAILWKVIKGEDQEIRIMDKIYSTYPSIRELFISYAESHDMAYRYIQNNQNSDNSKKFMYKGKKVDWRDLHVDLERGRFDEYVYIDTFRFIDRDNKKAYNDDSKLKNYINCCSTGGGYEVFENVIRFVKYVDFNGIVIDKPGLWYNNRTVIDNEGRNEKIAGITEEGEVWSRYWNDSGTITYGRNVYLIEKDKKYDGETKYDIDLYEMNYTVNKEELNEGDLPKSLVRLFIDSIVLRINYLPPNLEIFECRNTSIESLPDVLPNKIQKFNINRCSNIKKLPILPDTLKVLSMKASGVEIIDQLPEGLEGIYATNGKLKKFDCKIPNSVNTLSLAGSRIEELPNIPHNLTYLDLSETNVVTLPPLNDKLDQLVLNSCDNFKELPHLPDSLRSLDIRNTIVSVLPNIPSQLDYIESRRTLLPTSLQVEYGGSDIRVLRKRFAIEYGEDTEKIDEEDKKRRQNEWGDYNEWGDHV